jgi:hypothetical protein
MERPALLGRRGKDFVADRLGGDIGDDLELGAVLQDLRQPAMRQGGQPLADQFVDLGLDLAAGHADPLAEDHQQALGDLEPLRAVAVQVERDDPPLRGRLHADEVAGQHGGLGGFGIFGKVIGLRPVQRPAMFPFAMVNRRRRRCAAGGGSR